MQSGVVIGLEGVCNGKGTPRSRLNSFEIILYKLDSYVIVNHYSMFCFTRGVESKVASL